MPLTAEYTWVESETTLQLQVPLKGQPSSKLDVFATECYLKVSFPPYLLEIDLEGCIDSAQPKARVANGTLMIKARKKDGNTGLWGSLGKLVDRKCDPAVKNRREESIKEKLKQEQELKERVSLRKHEDERLALRSQMSVEEDERRRIEDIKAKQKKEAEAEMYRSFAELASKQNRGECAASNEVLKAAGKPPNEAGSKEAPGKMLPPSSTSSSRNRVGTIAESISENGSPVPKTTEGSKATVAADEVDETSIWKDDETGSSHDGDGQWNHHEETGSPEVTSELPRGDSDQEREQQYPMGDVDDALQGTHGAARDGSEDADESPVSYTPAPRTPVGVVPIEFTTRLFPTPLRESKVADESAWVMKNRKHLHKNKSLVGRLPPAESGSAAGGAEDPPLDISESDPVWLKGRGDDLYRGGDFLGAVNAYSAALDADPKAATCLSNRAACYLRLSGSGGGGGGGGGNNSYSYASACVADCGAALGILQASPETGPRQAKVLARRSLAYRVLGFYGSSLEDCRAALVFSPGEVTLLEDLARGEPLARGEQCKKEAATRFAAGDLRGACEMYTAALEAIPSYPPALSNRAACHLAMGEPRECIRDCTAVLNMLCSDGKSGRGSSTPSLSPFCGGRVNDKSQDSSVSATVAGHDDFTPSNAGDRLHGEGRVAGSAPALMAPSFSPPYPPPPVGSMPPPRSEKRAKWVVTTALRRARANVQLDDLEGALMDYRLASSASPGNEAIEKDLRELERRVDDRRGKKL